MQHVLALNLEKLYWRPNVSVTIRPTLNTLLVLPQHNILILPARQNDYRDISPIVRDISLVRTSYIAAKFKR